MNGFNYLVIVFLGIDLFLNIFNLIRHNKLYNFSVDKIAVLSKESSDTEEDSLLLHDVIGEIRTDIKNLKTDADESLASSVRNWSRLEDDVSDITMKFNGFLIDNYSKDRELLMKHETYLKDLDTELVQNMNERDRLFNEGLSNILNFSYDDVAQINKEAVYVEK